MATKTCSKTVKQYIKTHAFHACDGACLVPDRYETPERVRAVLIRRYGKPRVPPMTEIAYWLIDDAADLGIG